MSTTTINICPIAELWDDPEWEHVSGSYGYEGGYEGMPTPSPQRQHYERLEAAGVSTILRVDSGGLLVGFAILITTINPHYGQRVTIVESAYILPRHRGSAGVRLVRAAESAAVSLGSVCMIATAPIGSRLGRLYELLGFRGTSTTYMRMLG